MVAVVGERSRSDCQSTVSRQAEWRGGRSSCLKGRVLHSYQSSFPLSSFHLPTRRLALKAHRVLGVRLQHAGENKIEMVSVLMNHGDDQGRSLLMAICDFIYFFF